MTTNEAVSNENLAIQRLFDAVHVMLSIGSVKPPMAKLIRDRLLAAEKAFTVPNKSINGHDKECLCQECVVFELDGKGGNGYYCERCDKKFRDDDAYFIYPPVVCPGCINKLRKGV